MKNILKILGVAGGILLLYLLIGHYKDAIFSFISKKNNTITGNFFKVLGNYSDLYIILDGRISNITIWDINGNVTLENVFGNINGMKFHAKKIFISNFVGNFSGGRFDSLESGDLEIKSPGNISIESFEDFSVKGKFSLRISGFSGVLSISNESVRISKYSFEFTGFDGEIILKDNNIILKGKSNRVSFWRE